MRRREFINLTAGATVAWPLVARAQQPDRIWRIGFLRVGRPPSAFIDGFLQGMRDQGAVENQHFVID
jgi:putative ABC transport system substrate-binding protein